jgi:hypothetical protein
MSETRDYVRWHDDYEDPNSALSWRLGRVREYIASVLDAQQGDFRIVSSCAGDGRDVLGVLARRADAERCRVTLLEINPDLAARARAAADAAGLGERVEVRTVDAGWTDAYAGAVPADLVLLVGIFGNISDADVRNTIDAAPQFCAPGATLVWSRSRGSGPTDRNDVLRRWFTERGFHELDYAATGAADGQGACPALGAVRWTGPATKLVPGRQLFTFVR